jgi:hypothetical protein
MEIILPVLPREVGFISRQFETPGVLVEDGGKIISVPSLIKDDIGGNEMLYTTTQMKEYAFAAILETYRKFGKSADEAYYI